MVLGAVPGGRGLDGFDEGEQEVQDGGCAAAAGRSGGVFQGAGGGLEPGAGGAVEDAGAGGPGGLLEGGGRGADLVAYGGGGRRGGDGEEVAEGGDVTRTLRASGTGQNGRRAVPSSSALSPQRHLQYDSAAAAVLTTTDLSEAISAVRTLLGMADIDQGEVDFEAVIRSPDVLTQVRHVLPDLEWWALAGEQHGSSKANDNAADRLPIRVFDWGRPLDCAELFAAALGPDPAAVRWDLNAWPAVPEAGLEAISQKYAYLTLTVNSRDLYQDESSQDHTVHVHVRDRNGDQIARVHWLADQVGGRFTGRVELAPL
ncbi:hypothetical protein [Streptomyces anulatus]|uniref:hypothetical protein n=1 Tax=Streptomyces anulatus TaxID=1892 RepID=UPI0037225A17